MSNIKENTLKVLKKVGAWFASRWVGFFLLIPVAIANFVFAFVYKAGFFETEYKSVTVFVLAFMTVLAFVLACFRPTARYAPVVMFALQLVTFGVFVETSYMFLSTPFFNGIQGNIFVQAGFHYSYSVLCLVLGMIITAVAMCFRQYKDQTKTFFGTPEYAVRKGEEAVSEK